MLHNILLGVFSIVVVFYVWNIMKSHYSVKPIAPHMIDLTKHCVIDIRDFITSHRSPMSEAENIPLSYLPRTAREKGVCSKDIIFVTDGRKAAGIAARIVSRQGGKNKKQFFYMVV